ncbi:MAG: fructosamine kinase family protein [Ignavibacteriaceae bacterium]|nr:fructosamine kinase family protein [Ignavibacteriaceae bacterium]
MKSLESIKKKIEEHLGSPVIETIPMGGGCINNASKIVLASKDVLFLKYNFRLPKDIFTKEANGLNELLKADAIRVPKVILSDENFLLIEFINSSSKEKKFFEYFGKKFAALHKFTGASFGFYENNYIGSNLQLNTGADCSDWTQFYFENRLLFQFRLAEKNGYATDELKNKMFALEKKIHNILSGINPQPSLLHGDLWSGNFISDKAGKACLIDPAVYYGHREADLAMTKLFGGFDKAFYESYNEAYPLEDGYAYRENIYKLYHVLNHLNLFGRGYYSQAISLMNFYL